MCKTSATRASAASLITKHSETRDEGKTTVCQQLIKISRSENYTSVLSLALSCKYSHRFPGHVAEYVQLFLLWKTKNVHSASEFGLLTVLLSYD